MPPSDPPPLPRDQFPVAERFRFFNHAGVAPLPQVAVDEINRCATAFAAAGSRAFDEWDGQQERARVSGARILGVDPECVALVKNTTEGLSFVANGLPWTGGERVLVPDREFPTNVYPWLSLRELGVDVDLIDPVGPGRTLPLELFEAELKARPTTLVAVSWVQFARGWRTDLQALADLCHEHGALLCVDVIQGLGVIPAGLAAWGVDFAAADAHKWLLGPLGIGVMYVAPQHLERLRPLEPGWASVVHRDDYDNLELVYDTTARRFEGGSYNNITIAGMGASFDLLLDAGIDTIWAHVDGLCDHLVAGVEAAGATVVSDRTPEGRSGVVTFTVPDHTPAAVVEWLSGRDIVAAPRGDGVRVSPHGYTSVDDVDELVAAVRDLVAGSA